MASASSLPSGVRPLRMPPARIQPKNNAGQNGVSVKPDPAVLDSPNPSAKLPPLPATDLESFGGANMPARSPSASAQPSTSLPKLRRAASDTNSVSSAADTHSRKRTVALAPADAPAAAKPPSVAKPASARRAVTSPRFYRRSTTKKMHDVKSFTVEVVLEGGFTTSDGGTKLVVTFDVDAPHTLSWQLDVFGGKQESATTLPATGIGQPVRSHHEEIDTATPAADGAPAAEDAPATGGAPATDDAAPRQSKRGAPSSPSSLRTHPLSHQPEEPALPKGSCLLYLYPKVMTSLERVQPSAAGVEVLRQMLLAIAAGTSAFTVPDPVGAYPLHALVVCNSPESLDHSIELYRRHPKWLKQVHAPSGPFFGESSFHIVAVNKCEKQLIQLLEIATDHLTDAEVSELLKRQAEGPFFTGLPMRLYGSTALAYACCFDLRDAVRALLATGHVGLNDREDACKATGMMPIHAVVANSQDEAYEFLTLGLPRLWRADATQLTRVGRLPSALELAALSPLQLAAALGDRALVRYMLKKQCEVMWVWGPVTQFALDLKGIDSSGTGGGDVMELIVRIGARRRCCEMLLDSFMNGFIWKLYQIKWKRFGRRIWAVHRILDFLIIILLTVQTFNLKSDPACLPDVRPLSSAVLVLIGLQIMQEACTTITFVLDSRGRGDGRIPVAAQVKLAIEFLKQHNVLIQFLAYALALVGSIFIFSDTLLPHADDFEGDPAES
jgi:hypothetical protein